jgi:hypothetical protein
MGYVDEKKRIRRRDGILIRGEVVGQIKKDNKAHAEDGIFLPGEEWGYVDDAGNIDRWRGTIYNLRPGGRSYEIQSELQRKIADVEDRIRSKQARIDKLEDSIQDIESKLRR